MQATPRSTVVFQLPSTAVRTRIDWPSAWPDALAFAVGLAVAYWAGWTAGDLIWSLWLSSLVVGYATIAWTIGNPAVVLTVVAWRDRNESNTLRGLVTFTALILVGAAFLLGFFTLHFGGFHFIHSGFLLHWFPIDGPGIEHPGMGGKAVYLEVVRRYWVFLPSAFLSHRAAFMRLAPTLDANRWFESLSRNGKASHNLVIEPYRNVLRLHVLIFFFAFAHFAKLENFAVYAVIYAVYFFPWRLVRREAAPDALPQARKTQRVA